MTFGLVVARWAHVAPPRGLFHVVGAIVALALTLLSARRAHADELHARVDTNVVEVGQTVSLRLEGSTTSGDVGNVDPGPTPGFRIIGRSVMPTRMVSIVNGVRTDKTGLSATFTLLAEKTGTTTLGPCTVTFGGRQVRSARVDVRVVPRGQGPKQAAPRGVVRSCLPQELPAPHESYHMLLQSIAGLAAAGVICPGKRLVIHIRISQTGHSALSGQGDALHIIIAVAEIDQADCHSAFSVGVVLGEEIPRGFLRRIA